MNGGGGDAPWQSPPMNGGDFLLQLLQKPPHQPRTTPPPPAAASAAAIRASPPPPPAQILTQDPAVAAVGPTLPFSQFPTNGHDLRLPYVPHSPPLAPHNYFLQGLPQNPNPNWSPSPAPPAFNQTYHHQNPQFNHQLPQNDVQKLGFFGANTRPNSGNQEHNLVFGSFHSEIRDNEGPLYGNSHRNLAPGANIEGLRSKDRETGLTNRGLNNLEAEFQNSLGIDRNSPATSSSSRSYRSVAPSPSPRPPPGFPSKPNGIGASESGTRRSFGHNVDHEKGQLRELNHQGFGSIGVDERERKLSSERRKARGNYGKGLTDQLDLPGPPAGSNLHSVSASDVEESMLVLHGEIAIDGEKPGSWRHGKVRRGGQGLLESDDPGDQLIDTLVLEDEFGDKNDKRKHQNSRDKDYRSDMRGQRTLGQRMRNFKRQIDCRIDIDRLNAPLLAIFESLIPPEEEKAKQKQLLTLLEKLVSKEWPEARLYLYGSCASSFGVSKSDIDVCLAIEDAEINKSEVLLKLAEILESDNLQNVQALTRARVPIVKLFDPVTGISCDICINNMLAVVNTKLLRDYAQIDARLQQLAFIVKHWAKSRGVNETYHGTLSSYAYVLMCIHFLQQRKPAILPCLQGMEITYAVTVDNVECAYFDQVEKLHGFGCRNRESIGQLVWAFFNYWAYCHDYASDVISVRTGSTISKRAKDWTRRIGNDRHLICIEDPLETSHDLGRVVDKYSIKVLREEFERAAEILQYDPNPCVTLFETYVPT